MSEADAGRRRFAGKRAVVTGGSAGFGRLIAEDLAAEGGEVMIVGRREGHLREVVAGIEAGGGSACFCAGDLSSPDFCEQLAATALERWPAVDVLVNNAGLLEEAAFLEIELDSWNAVLAVMLQAPFLLSQHFGRAMSEQGHGAIVNMASIDGRAADGPYTSYSVAKAGLIQLTRNVAVELGPRGVRANSVSPGWAQTDMLEEASSPQEWEKLTTAFDRAPLGRTVLSEEVSSAVLFLASDEASGITATDLVVDGGTTADLYIIQSLGASDKDG